MREVGTPGVGVGRRAGKHTAVLLDDPCTPELMYLMCGYLAASIPALLEWLNTVLPAAQVA